MHDQITELVQLPSGNYSIQSVSAIDRVLYGSNLTFHRATKDTVLPLSEPVHDVNGKRMDEIAMPKGSEVFLDFFGCNTSKMLWGEDAYEWNPERWMSPLPAAVTDAHIPGVYSNV